MMKPIRNLVRSVAGTRLWLYPTAGLCNRLRALDSAIHFSRAHPCRITVVWELKDELYCRLESLFEPLPVINWIHTFNCKNRRGLYLRKTYQKFLVVPWADAIISAEEHHKMSVENAMSIENESTESLLIGRATCLETWMRFYEKGRPFADFIPVPHLRKLIDEQARNFTRTVGVHIRRTDNVVAIAHSPTSRFHEAMDREIQSHPQTTFFLSTDSPGEEAALRARYPGKILSYRKRSLNRDAPTGIEDAVVDLYSLSRTVKILGSYRSSFTTTAAAIGGIEEIWMQ